MPESNASRRDRRRRTRMRLDRAEAVAEEASIWALVRWAPGEAEVLAPGRARRGAGEVLGAAGDGADLVSPRSPGATRPGPGPGPGPGPERVKR